MSSSITSFTCEQWDKTFTTFWDSYHFSVDTTARIPAYQQFPAPFCISVQCTSALPQSSWPDLIQGVALGYTFVGTLMRLNSSVMRALAGAKENVLSFSVYIRFLQLVAVWAVTNLCYQIFEMPEKADRPSSGSLGLTQRQLWHGINDSIISGLSTWIESSICIYLLRRSVGRQSLLFTFALSLLFTLCLTAANLWFYWRAENSRWMPSSETLRWEMFQNAGKLTCFLLISVLGRLEQHSVKRGLIPFALFLAAVHLGKMLSYLLLYRALASGFCVAWACNTLYYAAIGKVVYRTLLRDSAFWTDVLNGERLRIQTRNIDDDAVPLSESLIPFNQLLFLRSLNRGGGGSVDLYLWVGKTVAVKTLTLQMLTSAYLDSFTREASLQRELNHPNVVQFLGVYCDPPRLGIVMEYCHNGSLYHVLQERLRTKQKLDLAQSPFHPIKVAIDIARGLQYLQSLKLLHRDVKSLNVLLDKNWNAKIADFGECLKFRQDPPFRLDDVQKNGNSIPSSSSSSQPNQSSISPKPSAQAWARARARGSSAHPVRRNVPVDQAMLLADDEFNRGTAAYLAPELLTLQPITMKTDVFAFAIVFWELLTSQTPFVRKPRQPNPAVMELGAVASSNFQISTSHMSTISRVLSPRTTQPAANFPVSESEVFDNSDDSVDFVYSMPTPESKSILLERTFECNDNDDSDSSSLSQSPLLQSSSSQLSKTSPSSSLIPSVHTTGNSRLPRHASESQTSELKNDGALADDPSSWPDDLKLPLLIPESTGLATSSSSSNLRGKLTNALPSIKLASPRCSPSLRPKSPLTLHFDHRINLAASLSSSSLLSSDCVQNLSCGFDNVTINTITSARQLVGELDLRPPIPMDAPVELKLLLQQCWHREPARRPDFGTIIATLERFMLNQPAHWTINHPFVV